MPLVTLTIVSRGVNRDAARETYISGLLVKRIEVKSSAPSPSRSANIGIRSSALQPLPPQISALLPPGSICPMGSNPPPGRAKRTR